MDNQKGKSNKSPKPKRKRRTRNQAFQQTMMVAAPVAKAMVGSMRGPRTRSTPNGVIVENSESVAALVSNTTANAESVGVTELSVRTGTLPWLRQLGSLYAKYRFKSLKITYEPYCPTSVGGQVVFALVYDENDSNAVDITVARLLQTFRNARTAVWSSCAPIAYDPKRAAIPWYVSKPNPAASTLANLSVPCWLVFAYFSPAVSTPLGRFMAHYVVELIEPIAPDLNG